MTKYLISGILTALCLSSPVDAKAPASISGTSFDLRVLHDSTRSGEERPPVQVLNSGLDALDPYFEPADRTESVVIAGPNDEGRLGYGFLDRERLHFSDQWHSDFNRTQVRHHQPILGIRLTQPF